MAATSRKTRSTSSGPAAWLPARRSSSSPMPTTAIPLPPMIPFTTTRSGRLPTRLSRARPSMARASSAPATASANSLTPRPPTLLTTICGKRPPPPALPSLSRPAIPVQPPATSPSAVIPSAIPTKRSSEPPSTEMPLRHTTPPSAAPISAGASPPSVPAAQSRAAPAPTQPITGTPATALSSYLPKPMCLRLHGTIPAKIRSTPRTSKASLRTSLITASTLARLRRPRSRAAGSIRITGQSTRKPA